jgi:hydroxymethylglutaryl-CoA lyase
VWLLLPVLERQVRLNANKKEAGAMDLPKSVHLREVALRDGFQSLSQFIPTADKLQVVEAMANAGVKELETTSFVSPKAIPQLADAAELLAKVPRRGLIHAAMAPNVTGAGRAVAAGADRLVVVISASNAHNLANVHRSVAESVADLEGIFAVTRERGVPVTGAVSVAFGCPFQGDVPAQDVLAVASAFISRGAQCIILADTTGMATPTRIHPMARSFQERFPKIDLVLHFHNNRGTAMANLLAALQAGVNRFDTALGGIGGCPNVPKAAGNLATEDVVYMLEDMGVATGIQLDAIITAAQLLESILGFPLPGQVMKSGPRLVKERQACVG